MKVMMTTLPAGTTALDRKALPIPAVEEAAATEAVPAAGGDTVELQEHRSKKAKKQRSAAESAPALIPPVQPAADINRWDADPEAADAEMTAEPASQQQHEALDTTHSVPTAGPKTLQPAKAVSKKQKKAAREAMKPSAVGPSPASGNAPGLPVNINRWDADPEALAATPLDLHSTGTLNGMSSGARAAERQHEFRASPTANGIKRKSRPSKLQPVAGVSGDDLGDEFDIAVENEEEEEGQRNKKGKRKQAGPGGKRDAARDLPAWQSDIAPAAKQMKQVVF